MPAAKQAVHEAVGYHICCLTITVMTMHAQCFTVTGRACSRLRAPIQARHLQLVIASSTSHTAAQPAHSLPIGDQMNQQQRLRNGQASSSLQHAGSHDIVQHLQSEQKPFTAAHHGSKRRRLDYASGHRAPQVLDPEEELLDPQEWDLICDVRSPSEYDSDHVVEAISTPVLNNAQHAEIGTLYKQSQHAAKRLGAAYISANIAGILHQHLQAAEKETRILVYCWRGGNRSASLAHVLSQIGFNVAVLSRGYNGYRKQVRMCMEALGRFDYHIISGQTGSGKGKLLDALRDQGAQVVDLEGAAEHKGSVLGDHPDKPQPPQKMFESLLLAQMRHFSVQRPVWIESESAMVGLRDVPRSLWKAMQQPGHVTELQVPMAARVAWLNSQYTHFHQHPGKGELLRKLQKLRKIIGGKAVTSLCGLAEAEDWDNFVEQLLLQHYDAAYDKARRRHQQAASQQRAKHPKREDGPDAGLSVELSTSQSVSPVEMSTSQSVSPASTANTPGDSGCIVQPNMHLLSLPNMDDDIFSEAALNLLKTYDPAALQIT